MVTKCRFSIQHYSLISKILQLIAQLCLCRQMSTEWNPTQRLWYDRVSTSGRSGLVLLRWIPKVDVPESLPASLSASHLPISFAFPLLPTHKWFCVLRVE